MSIDDLHDVPPRFDAPRWGASRRLLRRAQEIIPGGAHLSSRPLLPDEDGPLYMSHGRGSRVWDVDGHEYVDFFMGFGPFFLGYAQAEIDGAALAQIARGHLLSMSHPMHVRFIEALLEWFPGSEMGVFLKTGSEATTAALRIARRATGRRRVVRCGYHGWHDWCLPLESFVPSSLAEQVFEFAVDMPGSLESILDAHPNEFAAVILAPEMARSPDHALLASVRDIAHRHGAVFILDEVKTAFRTKPGSIQQRYGIVPDLTTVSKALGNGWPVAAVIGKRDVMSAAAGMHYSATFHGDTSSMAAALEVMKVIRRDGADEHAWALGETLIDGLNALARGHHVPALAYGEPLPPMPFMRFEYADAQAQDRALRIFYNTMLRRGFLLHPRHMWFISAAHTLADIHALLDTADAAFHAVSRSAD